MIDMSFDSSWKDGGQGCTSEHQIMRERLKVLRLSLLDICLTKGPGRPRAITLAFAIIR